MYFMMFYYLQPGISKAVASDDIYRVRYLVNQWCRVNVEKVGVYITQIS